MTDRQAKLIGIEAAWRIALRSPIFPTLHGSCSVDIYYRQITAFLVQAHEEHAQLVLAQAMTRQADMITRSLYLKAALFAAAAAALMTIFAYFA